MFIYDGFDSKMILVLEVFTSTVLKKPRKAQKHKKSKIMTQLLQYEALVLGILIYFQAHGQHTGAEGGVHVG